MVENITIDRSVDSAQHSQSESSGFTGSRLSLSDQVLWSVMNEKTSDKRRTIEKKNNNKERKKRK